MKTFYVETYGCQMNFYDSQVIDDILVGRGLEKVDRPEKADLILLNTCSVREKAEQRVRGRVSQLSGLRRLRDEPLTLGLLGCMAQRLGESLLAERGRHLDFVVGPDQYGSLPDILDRAERGEEDLAFTEFDRSVSYQARPKLVPPGGTHFLSVMRGCDKFCSYCIVPFTRGRERSKSLDKVIEEARSIADQGGFEIMLLGQTISSYVDGDVDFAGLLEAVSEVEGIQSIRFMTSYPSDLTPDIFRAIARLPKVETRLHLPVQSGSDPVLKRMNRRYTLAEYETMLDTGRREVPGILYSTDLIVGFPGETDEDFDATLDLVRRQNYVSAYMFKYSPREGTLSARWEDDVPQKVKEERLARLLELQGAQTREHLELRVGGELEILLDEPSKKAKNQLRGRTRDNFRVVVERAPGLEIGIRVRVKIDGIIGETLVGHPL